MANENNIAPKPILTIYNELLRHNDDSCSAIYYSNCELSNDFSQLEYSDIKQYFITGGKQGLVIDELERFFSETEEGRKRVRHTFSVYLMGIYCYDNIEKLRESFNKFIHKIWEKTGCESASDNEYRRDFLYLWFLTVLFHDMGYAYECRGDSDNSRYSIILKRKSMFSKGNLDCHGPVWGIPENLRLASNEYFYQRRVNSCFNKNLCTDHGFAGGYILYEKLKELHYRKANEEPEKQSPVNSSHLVFSPVIFQGYNIPAAWAIICHNIWLAEEGTGRANKYELLRLDKLICPKDKSPIQYTDHPLLFLLDFIDTIDFAKRCKYDIGCLQTMNVNCTENSISFAFDQLESIQHNLLSFFTNEFFARIARDMSFLVSQTFSVEPESTRITFKF